MFAITIPLRKLTKSLHLMLLFLLVMLPLSVSAFQDEIHPFPYDLHLSTIQGQSSEVMVCFHGMGGDYRISHYFRNYIDIDETLVSFNFPDYRMFERGFDPYLSSFGTINELLPALYVLKLLIIDRGQEEINLYGFSAGGGALINTLAILNSSRYPDELLGLGITPEHRVKILEVIQKGRIILDAPLKSLGEVIDFQGPNESLEIVRQKYVENDMEPIAALEKLQNLSLHILLHFQIPDQTLSNRDDLIYFDRLKKYNRNGTTALVLGYNEGHASYHSALWNAYLKQKEGAYYLDSVTNKTILGIEVKTSPNHHVEDCQKLWKKFLSEIFHTIPNKIDQNIYAIYDHYEGDHTQPYNYMIGCEVCSEDIVPAGMIKKTIPQKNYAVFSSSGSFTDSLAQTWQKIWEAPIRRSFNTDFEIYPMKPHSTQSSEIKVYISLEEEENQI